MPSRSAPSPKTRRRTPTAGSRAKTGHSPEARPAGRARVWILSACYFASGLAFLAIETLWIREAGLHIGNTSASAALVVATFFVCAALGNRLGVRALARGFDATRLYAAAEALTALTAGGLYSIRSALGAVAMVVQSGGGGAAEYVSHVLYVLALAGPASICAGIGFAAVSEAGVRRLAERTGLGAVVYGANLIGAALGVVVGGIALPMALGNAATVYTAAALEIAIAVFVVAAGGSIRCAENREAKREATAGQRADGELPDALAVILVAVSGAVSIGFEILAVMYLRQIAHDSVYTVSAALFAFIVDFGLGSLLAAALRRRFAGGALLGVSLAVSGAFAMLWPMAFHYILATAWSRTITVTGDAFLSLLALTTLAAAPVLVPAGSVFPLAWEHVDRAADHHGGVLGRLSSLNKLFCALGAILVPFVFAPLIGMTGTVILAGCLYLLLGAFVLSETNRKRAAALAIVVGTICAVPAAAFRHTPIVLDPGEREVAAYEGADGIVAVAIDAQGSHRIIVNQYYPLNGTDRALSSQRNESWIPLVIAQHAKRVAFIGMASGISADAALDYPIDSLDAVEINPLVVRAARRHFGPWSRRLFHDPRAHVIVDDGRTVIQTAKRPYDVVICTLMLPSQEGTGALYSRDFFAAVSRKLAPGGLFCLWLPTFQQDRPLAGMVVNTFREIYPNMILVRGNFNPVNPILGLVGSNQPFDLSTGGLSQRLTTSSVEHIAWQSAFLQSVANFRLCLVGDMGSTGIDFSQYGETTDDRPQFAFDGPRNLPARDALMGLNPLRWLGSGFGNPYYPSCRLDAADPPLVLGGVRAGNYYYAASYFRAAALDAARKHDLARQGSWENDAVSEFEQARMLSPQSDIGPIDLDR